MKQHINFKRTGLTVLTLSMLAVSFSGCGKDKEDQLVEMRTESTTATLADATTESTTEEVTTQSDTTAETTSENITDSSSQNTSSQNTNAYKSILDQYHTALSENWDFETLTNNNLNYMCAFYNGTGLQDIGYAFYDIDGDGADELLIGLVSQENRGGDVFDIYTLTDGKPVLLAQSGERDMYTLCQNGMISEAASNSAANSFSIFYEYKTGTTKLSLVEAVVVDGNLNPDNPYFYTTTDVADTSAYTSITESEGDEIISKYTAVKISFTPFEHY